MKFKYLVLPVFFFASATIIYADDISTGKGGLGGGLGVSERMLFSFNFIIEVHIIDSKTDLEIGIVSAEDLDDATENLPIGKYLLIYTDSNGNVIEEIPLLKE